MSNPDPLLTQGANCELIPRESIASNNFYQEPLAILLGFFNALVKDV